MKKLILILIFFTTSLLADKWTVTWCKVWYNEYSIKKEDCGHVRVFTDKYKADNFYHKLKRNSYYHQEGSWPEDINIDHEVDATKDNSYGW